jgi:hypothetical protein
MDAEGSTTYVWRVSEGRLRFQPAGLLDSGAISIERSVELGERGLAMYAWPIPWFWLFSKDKRKK